MKCTSLSVALLATLTLAACQRRPTSHVGHVPPNARTHWVDSQQDYYLKKPLPRGGYRPIDNDEIILAKQQVWWVFQGGIINLTGGIDSLGIDSMQDYESRRRLTPVDPSTHRKDRPQAVHSLQDLKSASYVLVVWKFGDPESANAWHVDVQPVSFATIDGKERFTIGNAELDPTPEGLKGTVQMGFGDGRFLYSWEGKLKSIGSVYFPSTTTRNQSADQITVHLLTDE